MYSNQDLNNAVDDGIFTQQDVEKFRDSISIKRTSPSVDEENFKLISGFNDIFVVIASLLTLLCAYWVTYSIYPLLAMILVSLLSWGLAEFFVRRRKMSFPAIMLLGIFLVNIFTGVNTFLLDILPISKEAILMFSAIITALATYLHWKRFSVPITVAFGMAVFVIFVVSLLLSVSKSLEGIIAYITLFLGFITFIVAMSWDNKDTKRITKNSDVAFWLHLLSAPLIVHSVFTILGVFNSSTNGISTFIAIILLYLLLSTISLVIDRRAFMVSSLAYVLYALTLLFKTYGLEDNSFAISGVFIGFSLLLLSGYWSEVRKFLLQRLPEKIQQSVPAF